MRHTERKRKRRCVNLCDTARERFYDKKGERKGKRDRYRGCVYLCDTVRERLCTFNTRK